MNKNIKISSLINENNVLNESILNKILFYIIKVIYSGKTKDLINKLELKSKDSKELSDKIIKLQKDIIEINKLLSNKEVIDAFKSFNVDITDKKQWPNL